MVLDDIVVRESEIHGNGVFANRDFKKGEVVIRWETCSRIITEQEFRALSEENKRITSYHNGEYVLFDSPGRYLNHSCDSNTKAENYCDVAVRDIHEGEEITCDYILEKVPSDFSCNCQSPNCREIIRGDKNV